MRHTTLRSAARGLLVLSAATLVVFAGFATALADEPPRGARPASVPAAGSPPDHRVRPIVIVYPLCPGPALPLPTPPPTPVASGGAGLTYQACPQLTGRAPAQLVQFALANPHAVQGYGLRRNPNVPSSPVNPYRTWLTLVDMGKPWNKCNTVVWKAGCP